MKTAATKVSRFLALCLALGITQFGLVTQATAAPFDPRVVPVAQSSEADNTKQNVRDKDGDSLTPMDQSSDKRDVELTKRIRKALVDDESLSTSAKNIKIITIDGKVTLRGPVETSKEHARVVKKATSIAGAQVDDQLDVKSR